MNTLTQNGPERTTNVGMGEKETASALHPTTRKARPKVRLSADVSPELYEKLTELSDEMHMTKSDVLRRAIALVDIALQAKKGGKKFGVAEADQPLATEIVGI